MNVSAPLTLLCPWSSTLLALVIVLAPAEARRAQGSSLSATEKQAVEIEKLREEVAHLRAVNAAVGPVTHWLSIWAPLAAAGVAAWAAWKVNGTINRVNQSKLAQEKELARERHLLDVSKELGSSAVGVRSAAVATLVQRLKSLNRIVALDLSATGDEPVRTELQTRRSELELDRARDRDELATIVAVLINATKHEDDENLHKFIADGLAEGLGARSANLAVDDSSRSRLADHDFQGARLTNAWWRGIDARGADFYRADLTRAGMAHARLQRAVFKLAKLERAVLRAADLSHANLANANLRNSDLSGADFSNADLSGADLTDAKVDGAKFDRARLDGVIGLERST